MKRNQRLLHFSLPIVLSFGLLMSFLPHSTESSVEPSKKLNGEEVSLVAVGDIMLSRTVAKKIKTRQNSDYPFLKTADFLKSADITFGNLENPITDGPVVDPFVMRLRADPGVEKALEKAGFDILSLANNHLPDFNEKGIADTLNYLNQTAIAFTGAGMTQMDAHKPAYLERKGLKFAFLAYNDPDVVPAFYEAAENHAGTAFMKKERMIESVQKAKQEADFVIVSMHSGTEYSKKQNSSQTDFAHAAIDAGAELVIGHHPHVIQPIELYKGKYILYSLGNFIFDQMQSMETREGLTVKIIFNQNGVHEINFLPVLIQDYSQPEFLEGERAEKILEKLNYPLPKKTVFQWNEAKKEFNKSTMSFIQNTSHSEELKTKSALINEGSQTWKLLLKSGQLTISQHDDTIWQSPDEWIVSDFAIADSDHNGAPNINLSVWKPGNYGTSKPFWVKKNDMSVKNHFFVFDFSEGAMKPVWQSSNLSVPNCEFTMDDVDGDKKSDLIVLEGRYSEGQTCNADHVAVWKWNGWGFSNEWRSGKGSFSRLKTEQIGGQKKLLVSEL